MSLHRHVVPREIVDDPWQTDDPEAHPNPDQPTHHAGPPAPHPDVAMASHPIASSEQRVPINLQAALPSTGRSPSDHLDDNNQQLLWFTHDAWLHRLQSSGPCCLLSLPDGFVVPDHVYWPLVNPIHSEMSLHDDVTIYIDGSARGPHAAWAVIVTAHLHQGECFIGCLFGTVSIGSADPTWIGASTTDNIAAELSALAVAQNIA